ncbi:MAG: HAMP domain-containing sensor histidine kinase [bacterium]
MQTRRSSFPSTLVTAALVMAIAVLAASGLWVIRNIYRQSARVTAARSVLDSGRMIAAQLADQSVVRSAETGRVDWASFSRLVRSLRKLERNLQYVAVSRDGVVVFQEQLSGVDGAEIPPAMSAVGTDPKRVEIGREILVAGTNNIPLVVFTADVGGEGGQPCSVSVGVRREAIERGPGAPSVEVSGIFKISVATIFVGFCICAVLVVLIMRRDARREDRRRAEEHLAFAGVLANGIVHDFRNPMSSLKLDVQMMQKEALKGSDSKPGRVAELAARAGGTIDRMDKIFQEFLFLSRPAPDIHERVRLGACIRDCLELLSARFEQAGVVAEASIPDMDLAVMGRPAGLKRAILNILTNAEHFSPRGGRVSVCCSREKDNAVIEVCDQGPGVPGAEKDRIFEMFVTTRPGGTGLGLALAKTAVEDSGGEITVKDVPGGGACFRIVLPLAEKA